MGEIKIESIIEPKDSTPGNREVERKNNELSSRKTIEKVNEKDNSSMLLEQITRAGILL